MCYRIGRSQTTLVGWKKIGNISVAILHAERERISSFRSPTNSLSKSQGLGKLLLAKPPQSAEWITGTEDVFEPILGVPSLGFYAEYSSKDAKLSLGLLFSSTASAELALSSVDEVWQRIPEETRATATKTQKSVKTRLLIELQADSRTALGDLLDILAAI